MGIIMLPIDGLTIHRLRRCRKLRSSIDNHVRQKQNRATPELCLGDFVPNNKTKGTF